MHARQQLVAFVGGAGGEPAGAQSFQHAVGGGAGKAGGGGDKDLSSRVTSLRKLGTKVFHTGLIFVLGPIAAFYMLVDLPDIRRAVEGLIPDAHKPRILFLGHRLNQIVGGFFRGQLAVAFIVGRSWPI